MSDSYLTISGATAAEIKVERSLFIANALSVDSKATAESEYRVIQKRFHDASHNCFAYVIGVAPDVSFRHSDDGEPSGTGGRPIYDSILSRNLTNVLVVVTRYFGGVKLGTGGLRRAYRDAACRVLDRAATEERFITQSFRLSFDHTDVSVVMKTLAEFDLKPAATTYGDRVLLTAEIRQSLFAKLQETLTDRSGGRATLERL